MPDNTTFPRHTDEETPKERAERIRKAGGTETRVHIVDERWISPPPRTRRDKQILKDTGIFLIEGDQP